jgi:hypothetical protein
VGSFSEEWRLKGNTVSSHFSEGPEGEKEGVNSAQPARHSGHTHQNARTGSDMTGALPALGLTNFERNRYAGFDFDSMLHSLHDLFEQDRQTASQQDATRCGLCYLHFQIDELHYREEGFYICQNCESALGSQRISMLHRQQKL